MKKEELFKASSLIPRTKLLLGLKKDQLLWKASNYGIDCSKKSKLNLALAIAKIEESFALKAWSVIAGE
jgi:hypothetical protein